LRDNRNGQTKNEKINEQALPGGIQENLEKYHRTVRLLAEILNLNLTNMKHECYPLNYNIWF
jgi:hypothetical protein